MDPQTAAVLSAQLQSAYDYFLSMLRIVLDITEAIRRSGIDTGVIHAKLLVVAAAIIDLFVEIIRVLSMSGT